MKSQLECNDVTHYVDNMLSLERHQINLIKIYNRSYEETNKNTQKSHVFNKRVIHNKFFSRKNIQAIEQYYIDKEYLILKKNLRSIEKRPNLSIKINPYVTNTLKQFEKNIGICKNIYIESLNKSNEFIGNRLINKKSYIDVKKFEKEYYTSKLVTSRAKTYHKPNLEKLGKKLINQSPIHKQIVSMKDNQSILPYLNLNTSKNYKIKHNDVKYLNTDNAIDFLTTSNEDSIDKYQRTNFEKFKLLSHTKPY